MGGTNRVRRRERTKDDPTKGRVDQRANDAARGRRSIAVENQCFAALFVGSLLMSIGEIRKDAGERDIIGVHAVTWNRTVGQK